MKKPNTTTNESKYIQQHLANERTYLAWIRTSIAMIGIGFVVANLHFSLRINISHFGDMTALAIGILAFLMGVSMIIFSSADFIHKQKQINNQQYITSNALVYYVSGSLILIFLVMAILLFVYLS